MALGTNPDGYVLSRTEGEYERLRDQSAIWEPLTDRVLAKAGLAAGMNVLDVGCGPGEVMRLMARRVGAAGSVTGVDIDPDVGAAGVARLKSQEPGAFHFHAADLTKAEAVPGGPFDLVFCRFLLIHMDDPVAMVRNMAAQCRPGGVVVAVEPVMDTARIAPFDPTLARGVEIINGTLSSAGRPLDAGVHLGEWFQEAGLPNALGTDLDGWFHVLDEDPMLALAVEGFGLQGVELGVTTAEEIARLPGEIRAITAERRHCFHAPTVTAAWTEVPE